jgi:5-methyltetrahydrofolate corrinoid/iron sulfur protein methyltransferase
MLLIGDNLQIRDPLVSAAVEGKDKRTLQEIAARQVEAGAETLSIDMSSDKTAEPSVMAWMVDTVQEVVDIPLALRATDSESLALGLERIRQQPLVDATSPAITDISPFVAAAARHGAKLSLAACPGGIPTNTEERIGRIVGVLVPQALEAGVPLRNIYIDAFVTSVTCDQPHAVNTVNTLRLLKVAAEAVPNTLVHLRDISDGAPVEARGLLNRTYLVMLMGAGLDAVMMDPLDATARAFMRVVKERDGRTPLSRLLLRLHDVIAAEAQLEAKAVDGDDPRQAAVYKTVQILTNQVIYADSYLRT